MEGIGVGALLLAFCIYFKAEEAFAIEPLTRNFRVEGRFLEGP